MNPPGDPRRWWLRSSSVGMAAAPEPKPAMPPQVRIRQPAPLHKDMDARAPSHQPSLTVSAARNRFSLLYTNASPHLVPPLPRRRRTLLSRLTALSVRPPELQPSGLPLHSIRNRMCQIDSACRCAGAITDVPKR